MRRRRRWRLIRRERGRSLSPKDGALLVDLEDQSVLDDDLLDGIATARSAAFDPAGSRVAIGLETGGVVMVDLTTGQLGAEYRSLNERAQYVAFSPDGHRLAVGSADAMALIDLRIGRASSARRSPPRSVARSRSG